MTEGEERFEPADKNLDERIAKSTQQQWSDWQVGGNPSLNSAAQVTANLQFNRGFCLSSIKRVVIEWPATEQFWCPESVLEHLCSSHYFGSRLKVWSCEITITFRHSSSTSEEESFQYMYISASKFLCIPMNISSKPAHSQFIWSKKEPARIKGSQKLFVTVCKKQNTK